MGLDQALNECLLWHGTSREAAETIVIDDFRIPQDSEMKHGSRFGKGAYFAEDLAKSLDYAKWNEGRAFVLLCRVLCGKFHYTEAMEERDGGDTRRSLGKHTVLANPAKNGPREFIVGSARQVYPEYIVEISVE